MGCQNSTLKEAHPSAANISSAPPSIAVVPAVVAEPIATSAVVAAPEMFDRAQSVRRDAVVAVEPAERKAMTGTVSEPWTRHIHILTDTQSAQGDTSSDTTCSPGHPPPPQPTSLLAKNDALMRIVSELLPHAGTTLLDDRPMTGKEAERCSSFIKGVHEGAATFDVSEGILSLINKKSNQFAMTITSVEGVLIVFVHPSIAEVDLSRAPSIQLIPSPIHKPPVPANAPPPGESARVSAVEVATEAPIIRLVTSRLPPAEPPWRIYGVPNFTADQQDVIKAFQFALNGGHESPFEIIKKMPDDHKLDVWAVDGQNMITSVRVAANSNDWNNFMGRHCDFLHSDMGKRGALLIEGSRSHSLSALRPIFYDTAVAREPAVAPPSNPEVGGQQTPNEPPVRKRVSVTGSEPAAPTNRSHLPIPFHVDTSEVQLFGGESGIGKTTIMLVGRCDDVDLVVYVCAAGIPGVVQWNHGFVERLKVPDFHASPESDAERRRLIGYLADFVEYAVGKELHESLCAYEGAFRVRLVFDEVGSLSEVVRALSGEGSKAFRELLRWGPEVSVYVVAGGTGVGAVDVPCSSQFKNYFLTRLRPDPSRVLWERMKEKVTRKANASQNTSIQAALKNVLREVDADAMCQSVCGNPRLAALMIVRCWNVAIYVAMALLVQPISSVDIRHRILMPVAVRFRSLNALRRIDGGHAEFRDVLVSALGYALFAGFRDLRPGRGRHLLSQIYGILVDNTYFTARNAIDPQLEAVALDDNGHEVVNPETVELACYPTTKGHYSISPAMVVVLQLLHAWDLPQLVRCEGDTFEAALAHMLYIAVQVYQGRPVVELLRFVFGVEAVSSSVTASLEGKALTYTAVVLRYNRTMVKMNEVVPLLAKNLLDPRLTPFYNMWSAEDGAAWVEVSPAALPSAGVVLHIPGVLTLPVVCKDVGVALLQGEIEAELDAMVRRVDKTTGQQAEKSAPPQSAANVMLVYKLADLGGVVVPVVCYSRSGLAAKHRAMKSAVHDVARVIFADGLGEDVSDEADPHGQRLHEARLVRRSMLPLTLRQVQAEGEVVIVDACSAR